MRGKVDGRGGETYNYVCFEKLAASSSFKGGGGQMPSPPMNPTMPKTSFPSYMDFKDVLCLDFGALAAH